MLRFLCSGVVDPHLVRSLSAIPDQVVVVGSSYRFNGVITSQDPTGTERVVDDAVKVVSVSTCQRARAETTLLRYGTAGCIAGTVGLGGLVGSLMTSSWSSYWTVVASGAISLWGWWRAYTAHCYRQEWNDDLVSTVQQYRRDAKLNVEWSDKTVAFASPDERKHLFMFYLTKILNSMSSLDRQYHHRNIDLPTVFRQTTALLSSVDRVFKRDEGILDPDNQTSGVWERPRFNRLVDLYFHLASEFRQADALFTRKKKDIQQTTDRRLKSNKKKEEELTSTFTTIYNSELNRIKSRRDTILDPIMRERQRRIETFEKYKGKDKSKGEKGDKVKDKDRKDKEDNMDKCIEEIQKLYDLRDDVRRAKQDYENSKRTLDIGLAAVTLPIGLYFGKQNDDIREQCRNMTAQVDRDRCDRHRLFVPLLKEWAIHVHEAQTANACSFYGETDVLELFEQQVRMVGEVPRNVEGLIDLDNVTVDKIYQEYKPVWSADTAIFLPAPSAPLNV